MKIDKEFWVLEMPVTAKGEGPALPEEIDHIEYEVWDSYCQAHASFRSEAEAQAHADKLNQTHPNGISL
jgi:hypothetical protein